MSLLNYGTVSKFLCQTGRFSHKIIWNLSLFFQVLVEDTSRDDGSSTATGQIHSEVSLWFSYSRNHSRLESLGYLLWSAGRDVGLGLVRGSEFVLWCLFCNNILQSWIFLCINFSMTYELSVAGLCQLAWLKGAEGPASVIATILLSCFEPCRFTLWKPVNCFTRRYDKDR